MKLATLKRPDGAVAGLVSEAGFLPLRKVVPDGPSSMLEVISAWPTLASKLEAVGSGADWEPYDPKDLLAPVPRPGRILAIGLNYLDHVTETGFTPPTHQVWFSKQASCANGPFAPVHIPRVSEQVDYEVELVVVIGERGRHIPEARALRHVFGYCVGNDVSVRDWQMRTAQWHLGKSFDTHGPFGPWITTADEIADPQGLDLWCEVNGERRQASNTRHLCFGLAQQIAYLSQVMTLEPGDVIFTGTPAGVGMGLDPPGYLRAGDVVRCEIDGLGGIENPFIPEPLSD